MQTDEAWAKDKEQREKRLEDIREVLAKEKEKAPPQWYVNGQGQTMVVLPGPVEFLMGSPNHETGHRDDQSGTRLSAPDVPFYTQRGADRRGAEGVPLRRCVGGVSPVAKHSRSGT